MKYSVSIWLIARYSLSGLLALWAFTNYFKYGYTAASKSLSFLAMIAFGFTVCYDIIRKFVRK